MSDFSAEGEADYAEHLAEQHSRPFSTSVPTFVPFVLPEDEARAVFGAVRAVFQSGAMLGEHEKVAPLARAMVEIARALDKVGQ